MNLEISNEAAEWYINEMDLEQGDYVQYHVQLYGGIPTAHPNYSLGVSIGNDGNVAVKVVVLGITFYFNDNDSWFLEEFDMKVVIVNGEPEFIFHKK